MQTSRWHSNFHNREHRWVFATNHFCSHHPSRKYFAIVSRLGDGIFWYTLMAVLFAYGGQRGMQAAVHMACLGLVSLLLYKGLKGWTKRPRPCANDRRIQAWVAPLDQFSFPSGHTLHAVAFSIIACAYFPALAMILVPFSLSVAASRVFLGLHYPSDVLAATVIGTVLASVSLWLVPGASLFQ